MTARTDLSKEGFFPGFTLDSFLEAKIVPFAPDRKQPVDVSRSSALRWCFHRSLLSAGKAGS